MPLLTIIGIAVGLAMDALAVSVASGLSIKRERNLHAFRIAFFFGLFQAVMPLAGWWAGRSVSGLIGDVDHWVAFILLSVIGGKMVYESSRLEAMEASHSPIHLRVLLLLSVATSIDALAVGLSLSLLQVAIVLPACIIGGITFLLSFAGVHVGIRFGHFFEKKLEAFGGLILIGIGVKILLDHL